MRVIRNRKNGGIAKLRERADELNKLNVFLGWLESSRYDDNTPVAAIAALHEYGAPKANIPSRSFLRPTQENKRQDWVAIIRAGAKAILEGKMVARDVMEILGQAAVGDIQQAIKAVTSPPLKPSTVAAKRRKKANGKKVGYLNKPLIEEAIMINSVTYLVGDKE